MPSDFGTIIEGRYKPAATLLARSGDWSGTASDLAEDRACWLRIIRTSDAEAALRAWRQTTEQAIRLGPGHVRAAAPRSSAGGLLYQTAELPQRRWRTLRTMLAGRGPLGWDASQVLIEKLAKDLVSAEKAGLQLSGDLASQVLIDPGGDLLFCASWEQAVRSDWAGPALLGLLEELAEDDEHPVLANLRSRQLVGRLTSALTVSSALQSSAVSRAQAQGQLAAWLDLKERRKRRWPRRVAVATMLLGASYGAAQLVALPEAYVPDVQGATAEEARSELRRAGWKVQTIPTPSRYRAGQVVSQWPRPGTKLAAGRRLRLRVATPLLDASVPEVVGLDPDTAREVLATSGLRMNQYMIETGPSNQVQSQQPAPGTKLRRGQSVTVNVAP